MNKIDLHVSLEGSLNIKHVNELIHSEAREYLIGKNCSSVTDYMAKFDLPIKLLQTRENLYDFSKLLAQDLYNDGVIYAEVRFCPLLHTNVLSADEVVEAVLEGLNEVKEIKTKLILTMLRNFNMDKNLEMLRLAKKYKEMGVVGLALEGDEIRYKTATFKQLFEIIKVDSIPFVIDAGEMDNFENVDLAIEFGASRIGHGIKSIESIKTLKALKEKNILLEICLSSNIDMSLYPNLEEYPFKKLLKSGVKMCINTNNRTISNTNLEKEYDLLKENYKLTNKDLLEFNMNAIEASFLGESEKAELIFKLRSKNE